MIFSKDLLFLHVPKTGGMSVTELLLDTLSGPVYYTHPDEPVRGGPDIVHIEGIRHETLAQAREVVERHGFALDAFPGILVVVRNPYALEVSRYSYLRAGHPWDFGHDQTLALTRDFATFARESRESPDLSRYFFLGREVPPNLRVIRFEQIAEELPAILSDLGSPCERVLPHENRSNHGDFATYYDRETEEVVHHRHRWLFDLSLYERMDRALLDRRATAESPAHAADRGACPAARNREGILARPLGGSEGADDARGTERCRVPGDPRVFARRGRKADPTRCPCGREDHRDSSRPAGVGSALEPPACTTARSQLRVRASGFMFVEAARGRPK